jgi:flagellar basal body L-ring protein FlgH
MTLVLLLALTQSLLQDDASPYDPPKKPALKKRDHVAIEFVEKTTKTTETKPKWDKEVRQWVRFDGKETASTVITAEVVDIRPNGNVVLQATKRRVENGVETTMRLTGEAAPANVTANKVSADHVANLTIAINP